MSYQIRPANESDLQAIHEHIYQMVALHKGMLKYCVVTVDQLKIALAAGQFEALVCEETGNQKRGVVGILIYHSLFLLQHGPGLYIETFFVDPDLQGQGLGSALLRSLARLAIARGANFLKLLYQEGLECAKMYERYGFINLTKGPSCVEFLDFEDEALLESVVNAGMSVNPPDSFSGRILSKSELAKWTSSDISEESLHNSTLRGVVLWRGHEDCASRLVVLCQLGFGSWFGRPVLYFTEFVGVWNEVPVEVLRWAIGSLVKTYDKELWAEAEASRCSGLVQNLEEIGFLNASREEGWNICILYKDGVKKLAEKKHTPSGVLISENILSSDVNLTSCH